MCEKISYGIARNDKNNDIFINDSVDLGNMNLIARPANKGSINRYESHIVCWNGSLIVVLHTN